MRELATGLLPRANVRHAVGRICIRAFALLTVSGGIARAQTDFYNTSVGRPLRIEDANPAEYRAVELNVAPLRVDLLRGNTRQWSFHPEATIGILPRTQLQISAPLTYVDARVGEARGLTGIEISALHALNMETSIPALAVAADVSVPAGPLGGDDTFGSIKGIVTRTFPWARLHANAQLTAGPNRRPAEDGRDLSRWLAGLAIDRTFPLHSLLLVAESYAEQPLGDNPEVAWTAATGLRYQLSPRWAMDAGVGRRFSGAGRAWHVTFGSAYALGLP